MSQTAWMSYPFSAVVGQDELKLALCLNAVAPAIGGVLVEGEKGNAKSTTVRAFGALLPLIPVPVGCPYYCDPGSPAPFCSCFHRSLEDWEWREAPMVELPLGATEDRVLGHLKLQTALTEGRQEFQPGLLAAAHRGVLYVDEVNLLDDHLVDLVLDAAAFGWTRVERDGFSLTYPARFILVGSMNPEEGELRPQLLDRFGLSVKVSTPENIDERVAIVQRRLAYNRDPAAFALTYQAKDDQERARITNARERLDTVALSAEVVQYIAELCVKAGAEGLRADIVLAEAARALAAYRGASAVTIQDVLTVAPMVLRHRTKDPWEPPPPPPDEPPSGPDLASEASSPAERPESEGRRDGTRSREEDRTSPVDETVGPVPIDFPRAPRRQRTGSPGARRITAMGPGVGRGRVVRRVQVQDFPDRLWRHYDWPASLVHARAAGRYRLGFLDLVGQVRAAPTQPLFVFLLDASASMAAARHLARVKGMVMALARMGYRRRAKMAVLVFRRGHAFILLWPTAKVGQVRAALERLPAGGNSPLGEGLMLAGRQINFWIKHGGYYPHLMVVTDGRVRWRDELERLRHWGRRIASTGAEMTVIDAEWGRTRLKGAQRLADILGADYVSMADVRQKEA